MFLNFCLTKIVGNIHRLNIASKTLCCVPSMNLLYDKKVKKIINKQG